MPLSIKNGETILFIGDSITDCGRRDPQHSPLGCGYVSFFADLCLVREPEKKIRVINTGIGGNTVEDLRSRWFDDALSHEPDWLSVKIGINDCNRWLSQGHELQSPARFAEIYEEILSVTVKKLPEIKMLLIDPFYAGLDKGEDMPDAYRAKVYRTLPEYLEAVGELARKFQAKHIQMHELFRKHMELRHPSVFFPNEPVHPNSAGHMLIAESVYGALSDR